MELKKAPTYKANIEEMKNFQLLFRNVLKQGYHKVLVLYITFYQIRLTKLNFLVFFFLYLIFIMF